MASAAWLRAIELNPASIMLARLYNGDGDNFLGVGTKAINFDGHNYKGLLSDDPIGVVNGFEISPESAELQIASATLTINNAEDETGVRFSDELENPANGDGANNYGFEGRQLEIALIAVDGEGQPVVTTWADSFIIAVGVMQELPDGEDSVTIRFKNEIDVIAKKLEDYLTDTDASDSVEGLPESSAQTVKPKAWGSHAWNKASRSLATDTISNKNNGSPCAYLGVNSAGKQRWMVSKRTVNELVTTTKWGQIWGKDNGRLVRLNEFTIESNNDTAGCIILTDSGSPTFNDYWYSKETVTTSKSGANADVFTNPTRINDGDFVEKSTGGVGPSADPADYTQVTVPFPDWDNGATDDNIIAVSLFYYGLITYAGSGGDKTAFTWSINGVDQDGNEPEGASYPDLGVIGTGFSATQAEIAADAVMRMTQDGASGSKETTVDIYEAYKIIRYRPTSRLDLFFLGEGALIGKFANGRSTAEGYTVTHADNDNDGALGEISSTLIEDFLRDDLSLELAVNGDMGSSTGWTLGADWAIGSGVLSGTDTATDAENDGVLRKGHNTTAVIEVIAATGGDLTLKLGSSGESSSVISTTGIKILEGRPAGSKDYIIAGNVFEGELDKLYISDAIDLDMLNIASVDQGAMKFAPSYSEAIESRDWLAQMALQSRSGVWMDEGKFKQKVIKDTYSSSDLTIPLLNYDSLQNKLYERTPQSWIYTSVEVLYGLDEDKKLTKTTGKSTNAAAVERYGYDRLLPFKAPFIDDDATALLLQAYLLAQWKQPHNIHPFSVGLEGIQLKVGDIYQLQNARKARGKDVNSSYTLLTQTIYPYWLIYDAIHSQFGADYRAIQLHRLDGS